MIVYLLLQGFDTILFFLVSLLPTLETPAWLATSLPQMLRTIMGFNLYLPVYEAVVAVIFCIGLTLIYRIVSSVSSVAGFNI